MYKVFKKLLEEKGISTYQVAKVTGINNATFSEWKEGTYAPKVDKLQKIADYFQIPLNCLLNGKEEDNEQ